MQETVREFCVLCDNKLGNADYLVKKFPIYMGVTTEANDIFFDQAWSICDKCGVIQLRNLMPLNLIYAQSHNSDVIGPTWEKHHEEFASFIRNNVKAKKQNTLEIGGANGYLANLLLRECDYEYLIIEPLPVITDLRIKVISGYFENNLNHISDKDLIIHSHVLEHLYDPFKSLDIMFEKMKIGSVMMISMPNIQKLIEERGANSLNFEHTYLLSPQHLEQYASKNFLEIVDKRKFINHSYFYAIKKIVNGPTRIKDKDFQWINIREKSLKFIEMWEDLSLFSNRMNNVFEKKENAERYLFGAHVFSQSLINVGLNSKHFLGVLDNAKIKQGKRLYGTELNVFDPNVIAGNQNPEVVVVATHYQDEIIQQLKELNTSVKIWEL